jgi:OOP family OmpA-OmpF porin
MRMLAALALAFAACGPSHPTPANPVHLVGDPDPQRGPMGVDTDGDAISDDVDDCPADAEDVDGIEDTDGCPDA